MMDTTLIAQREHHAVELDTAHRQLAKARQMGKKMGYETRRLEQAYRPTNPSGQPGAQRCRFACCTYNHPHLFDAYPAYTYSQATDPNYPLPYIPPGTDSVDAQNYGTG